jgi:hypothetical protein
LLLLDVGLSVKVGNSELEYFGDFLGRFFMAPFLTFFPLATVGISDSVGELDKYTGDFFGDLLFIPFPVFFLLS